MLHTMAVRVTSLEKNAPEMSAVDLAYKCSLLLGHCHSHHLAIVPRSIRSGVLSPVMLHFLPFIPFSSLVLTKSIVVITL